MNRDIEQLRRIAPLGGRASGDLQRNRALVKYLEASPQCLWCKKELPSERPTTYARSYASMAKRKFCSPACTQNYRWEKIREETGRPKPRKFEPACTRTPFKTRTEVPRAMINKHARRVYLSKYPEGKCEDCGYVGE